MNNKKKNEGQTDFSYYGLYLLDYLRTNKFEQATDEAFIRERADRAAETYEWARLEGYPADGAQELAMRTLLEGLHYSKYAILREVVENEFSDDVPEAKHESFTRKLLPLVGNVFSILRTMPRHIRLTTKTMLRSWMNSTRSTLKLFLPQRSRLWYSVTASHSDIS